MVKLPIDDDTETALVRALSIGALSMDAILFISWWLYRQRSGNPYDGATILVNGRESWRRYHEKAPHPNDA